MNILGGDFLRTAIDAQVCKIIFNETAAFFFPTTTEHRDATQPGLRYQDDSLGNALAATITPRRIDIRYHQAFSDERVTAIIRCLLSHPGAEPLRSFAVRYQGRLLNAGGDGDAC